MDSFRIKYFLYPDIKVIIISILVYEVIRAVIWICLVQEDLEKKSNYNHPTFLQLRRKLILKNLTTYRKDWIKASEAMKYCRMYFNSYDWTGEYLLDFYDMEMPSKLIPNPYDPCATDLYKATQELYPLYRSHLLNGYSRGRAEKMHEIVKKHKVSLDKLKIEVPELQERFHPFSVLTSETRTILNKYI